MRKLTITTMLILASVSIMSVVGLVFADRKIKELKQTTAQAEAIAKELKSKEEQDLKLGQYVINMMYKSGAGNKISDGKKQVLASDIVTVTNEVLEKLEHKQAWIGALAIESSFQKFAQSPTGPKGYSQLAKAAFHEGIANCSIGNVEDDDVWETKLNLYAGACYFRALLERPDVNGDPIVAMVMYNQGPNSVDAKKYAKTGQLDNLEALKYIAKASFLKRTVTDQKTPGIPSITDINKSSSKQKKVETIKTEE